MNDKTAVRRTAQPASADNPTQHDSSFDAPQHHETDPPDTAAHPPTDHTTNNDRPRAPIGGSRLSLRLNLGCQPLVSVWMMISVALAARSRIWESSARAWRSLVIHSL